MTVRFLAALATAAVAWPALVLQAALLAERMMAAGFTFAEAMWRFFGYFTILTNIGVALVATAMALAPASRLAGARVRLTAATSIAIVGVVYSLALRSIWNPTGWQAVVDHALHDVTPPLFVIAWLASGHGSLHWRDALVALAAPHAYCAYSFARGAADGWYPYWFLDPARLQPLQLALNIVLLTVAFWAVAAVIIAIDRRLARREVVN